VLACAMAAGTAGVVPVRLQTRCARGTGSSRCQPTAKCSPRACGTAHAAHRWASWWSRCASAPPWTPSPPCKRGVSQDQFSVLSLLRALQTLQTRLSTTRQLDIRLTSIAFGSGAKRLTLSTQDVNCPKVSATQPPPRAPSSQPAPDLLVASSKRPPTPTLRSSSFHHARHCRDCRRSHCSPTLGPCQQPRPPPAAARCVPTAAHVAPLPLPHPTLDPIPSEVPQP
jgi:hypothetical protein